MDFKNISLSPLLSLESNKNTTHNTNTHSHNLSLKDSSSSNATNNYGSHAPGILKAMKILEAQFSHSNASLSPSPSIYNHENGIKIYNNTMQMNMFNDAYHPNLLVARSSQSHEPPSHPTVVAPTVCVASVGIHSKKKNVNDGRIHSLPHKKYGPYTCPKCSQVLATSQKFASHVTSNHYKFESSEERKKRYLSKISKKQDLKIHQLNNGQATFVHVVSSTDQSPVASIVNSDECSQWS